MRLHGECAANDIPFFGDVDYFQMSRKLFHRFGAAFSMNSSNISGMSLKSLRDL
jgi:hypothetical protein